MDEPANHIMLRGASPGAADRMRELLARTVQDHVSDQRSHASALEEIRKHLEGLEWLVKEVRRHELADLSGQLAAQTEGLLRQLAEGREQAPAWAESLQEPLRALSDQVKPVAELPALWADLGVMSENVDQVLPRLQAASDMLAQAQETLRSQEERLAELQRNDVRLQQSMETAAGRFSRLDKAMAELSQRAGYLAKEVLAVKGRIDQGLAAQTARFEQGVAALSETLEHGLAGAAAKVDGLAANVSGLAGHVDLLGGQFQVAHGRLERLDKRLGDTDDEINAVDNKLAALDVKLTGTDGKVGALANRIDRLDDHIGDTDDKVGLINERIGSISERIGSIDGHMIIVDERTAPIDARLGTLEARLIEAVDGRKEAAGGHFTGIDATIKALDERVSGALAPLADELRLRPGHAEVEEIVAKVVGAAQAEMTTRLDSLEETVLTLAEALLRPARHMPDQRRNGDQS